MYARRFPGTITDYIYRHIGGFNQTKNPPSTVGEGGGQFLGRRCVGGNCPRLAMGEGLQGR
jgi:hypothetical protein